MINHIIAFSVRNKLIIGLAVIGLILFGIFELQKLPIDAVPDITNNQVLVLTQAPSYGATDIERLITFPIEQANSNINGIEEIRSFSRFGLSLVTIVFNDETDIYWARQQVAERLQQIQSLIPASIGIPELGPISSGLGEIYQYVVRTKKGYEHRYDETELRTIQDWIIRRQLLGVKGVAEVSSFGGKLKQYEVSVDPDKLHAFGLTIDDVFKALEQNNQNTGGSYIEKGPTVLFIRSEGLITSKEDIESIALESNTHTTPVHIRDVANVTIGYATRYGALCYNDEGEVAGGIVMMLKGANSSDVIKNVKTRIEQISKTLPEGVVIEPFLDRTKMVSNAIKTVETNLLEGALIVIFILVLFLGNLRAGLLVASVIPLSMLFAVIMMNAFGVSGNLMSLGALDFGLIVDGAVIIVEAVMHLLVAGKGITMVQRITQSEMNQRVEQSAGKMMNSAIFGQLVILIVYLPILSLQGIEGKMFKPMAQTVSFALIGAFLLSLTYIPMMSSLVLSKTIKPDTGWSSRMMAKLEKYYKDLLQKTLHYKNWILGTALGLFAMAIVLLMNMGGEFIPELEEGDFAVDTRVLTGSNLQTTIDFTQQAAHILIRDFPEVEKVVTKIGSGEVPTDPMPMEASDLMIILKDKSTWTTAKTFPELASKMGKALEAVPGITTGFQYPVQMRFNELMTGARQDVVCKVFGENLDTLALYATKIGALINTIDGAQELYVEPVTGMPQITINYHRQMLAQHQVSIDAVNNIVNMAFAGKPSGQVFEGERRFNLVVRLEHAQHRSLEDVRNLLIPTSKGNQIPLHQLADVSILDGPNQIQREDAKRRIVVGFNTNGRDVQSIVHDLQKKVESNIKFPAGYYVTYGGAFENLKAATSRLMIAVPISLVLIFILLFFAFGSLRLGLLIYSAIPLSAIGGIFLLAIRGMPFSISAGIGFIALFGVAVLNGIVLIAEFKRIRDSGVSDLQAVVMQGAVMRLRPVLMTALVASLGFLPMALSHGSGAEVQRPLATVVIGGLLLATFLTLFVLPVLYIKFETMKKVNLPNAAALIILMMLCGNIKTHAQTISLSAAIDTALNNNLSSKKAALQIRYQESLSGTAIQIPATQFSTEIGQQNSRYADIRLSAMQGFQMPAVYKQQKQYLQAQLKEAQQAAKLNQAQLTHLVTLQYLSIQLLRKRQELLKRTDSLYAQFTEKANIRFQAGATDMLEKATADIQRGEIWMQLNAIDQEMAVELLTFQWLLNTDIAYVPQYENPEQFSLPDRLQILADEHPEIKQLKQQYEIARSAMDVEKTKRLPEIELGINTMTMKGTGADNRVYNYSSAFTSAQVGIAFPIANKAVKSRIDAAGIQIASTANAIEAQSAQFATRIKQALQQQQILQTRLQYYQANLLPGAELIEQNALLKLTAGEINYLEWVMLMKQSIQIRMDYLDTIGQVNQNKAMLHYLTLKS
jgi:heavy metal efflux system protein